MEPEPLYKRYLQTYLAWRKELHAWIDDSNLSPADISRGHFVINLMTEAMAPTNSAANPAAVKRFFETGGKSLLDGLSHLAKDLVHNGGMPSQVNMGAFEVGKSLGVTEGAVVFRNDVLELIQYRPITEQVHERPLLVVPPQINKFYVFDLSPDKSLARFCLRGNVQTFIVSWRNPTKEQREWGLSTYIEALKEAVDVVTAITGSKDVNMLGACSGGITCTALLGHYAALGEKGQCPDPAGQRARHHPGHRRGVVRRRADPGSGQAPLLPGRCTRRSRHGQGVRLDAPQRLDLELLGQQLPVGQRATRVRHPVLEQRHHAATGSVPRRPHRNVQEQPTDPPQRTGSVRHAHRPQAGHRRHLLLAGTNDHITPWKSCYKSAQLFGGKVEFVLSSSGHIQSILNPPGNPKSRYMTSDDMPTKAEDWQENSTKHTDSWWLHWQAWQAERSGKLKKPRPCWATRPTRPVKRRPALMCMSGNGCNSSAAGWACSRIHPASRH